MRGIEAGVRLDSTAPIAAVIATLDRAALLRATLESLVAQRIEPDRFEVVVVDDGSTDDTRAVVASFADRLTITYSRQANAGLAAARNHGLFLTRAPLLLFLDDDDVADSDLLGRHLDGHARHPQDSHAILGYTRLAPELETDLLMHFVTEVGCFLFSYPAIRDGQVLDFTYFWGGRTSCKRQFLIDHGVFNPVFRFGCEDIELGFRLSRHGLRVVYDARAISTMTRKLSFDGFCDRLRRQGRSNFVFSQLHADPVVQSWTEVPGAGAAWQQAAEDHDAIIRSARALDRAAALRIALGLPLEDRERDWLFQGYWSAFRLAKVRGIIDARQEERQSAGCGSGPGDEDGQ